MALPVDAHSENQPPCYHQPAVLLPEAAAGTSSHQVEPFEVLLSTEQNPVPPNLRKVEQRVTAVRMEGAVFEEVMDASLLVESIEVKCGPEVEDLRGGAASETLTLSEVFNSSVIHSSNVGSSSKGWTHPDTHEFLSNPPSPCLVDKAEATSTESVKYSDPVSDISVKTNRKRQPEQESNQQKKKTKASLSAFSREVDVGSDNGDPSRVGATESILLNGTNLTTMIGPSPSGGNVASLDSGAAVNKNQQKMSSSNKTLIKAFEKIRTMADRMKLGRPIVDRANQLFEDLHNGKHLKGYRTDAIVASCLHIACRQEGVSQTFDDVCAVSNFSIKVIGRYFKMILDSLKISVDIITTTNFIPRFCGKLKLGSAIEKLATEIGRKAVQLDMVPGRSPISVAATTIYIASHALDNKLTKKELCVGTGVSEFTIRLIYKLMYPRVLELFPSYFNVVFEKLPPS